MTEAGPGLWRHSTFCRPPLPAHAKKVMLWVRLLLAYYFWTGVAAIVKDLVEFIQVRSLFETHITNWRKQNAEDVAKHRQAEAELIAYARQRPKTANPAEREWPLWRIHSSDFSSSELVPIPRELYDKVQNLRVDNRYHLLLALDDEREWTLTEGFTMLVEIHDAAFEEDGLGSPTTSCMALPARSRNLIAEYRRSRLRGWQRS